MSFFGPRRVPIGHLQGGGDSLLPGGTDTTPENGWNVEQGNKFDDAMSLYFCLDPLGFSDLNEGYMNGAIEIADIEQAPNSGETIYGQIDSNTLGIELDGRSVEEIAGTIAHEWQHRTAWASDPNYPDNADCFEADGRVPQIAALCAMLCGDIGSCSGTSVTCEEYRRVTQSYLDYVDKCIASGGTPTPIPEDGCQPEDPAPCPCDGD